MSDLTADNGEQDHEKYSTVGSYVREGEEYDRDTTYIEDRIVADPEHAQLSPGAQAWPVEPGRYRLVAARACPWANRTLIVRRLLGLEDAISLGLAGPTHDARSWRFDLDPDGRDPVLGTQRLQENYFARFPGYPRGITVPAMVDAPTGQVVTNDFAQMTEDFATEWREYQRDGAPDLWPAELVEEMRPVMRRVYTEINNGVYRCGFAGSQEAYDAAYERLWAGLDWVEERLATRRYLMGEHITEADVRLFTTLVRFDPVHVSHFKASRNKLTEMPNLWGYARDLFQTPGFGDTVDFQQIKDHYFVVHRDINPSGIVPLGPDLTNWTTPHGRQALGGSPFAPGATPPGPVRPQERVLAEHTPLTD
ncbi:glutathione S-transferase family protein [Kocuria varians]|uniref:Glutathionyl-hydroquinone reductase YqjG n=1 Tax=Kocuria varians TaxID=1272 RepID=A0A7D7KYT5_KOCVA|nr:glutathione S-transferase C-terminal domain-containing protein [Kocuria varians]QMS55655.1 Glutathionyl-hydroquinone reductase YqjG [Kocuria varians]